MVILGGWVFLMSEAPLYTSDSERTDGTFKGFMDFYLEAKARI